jgi:16S rRNA (uracil1498-N3)-methyltransferase
MRLHRFYLPDVFQAGQITITDQRLIHQWRNVLKFSAKDRLIIFSRDGLEHECELLSLERAFAIVRTNSSKLSVPRARKVTLYVSLIKKDKLEWVLEKCTEIGISHFAPVISDRSEKLSFNSGRAEKILIEATEQSGFGSVPELLDTKMFIEALENSSGPQLVCDTGSAEQKSDRIHMHAEKFSEDAEDIGIWVGPEGGWSERERELFRQNNVQPVSLGPSTLRAETAAIVASAFTLL